MWNMKIEVEKSSQSKSVGWWSRQAELPDS